MRWDASATDNLKTRLRGAPSPSGPVSGTSLSSTLYRTRILSNGAMLRRAMNSQDEYHMHGTKNEPPKIEN